jgi:hypothetical protein
MSVRPVPIHVSTEASSGAHAAVPPHCGPFGTGPMATSMTCMVAYNAWTRLCVFEGLERRRMELGK